MSFHLILQFVIIPVITTQFMALESNEEDSLFSASPNIIKYDGKRDQKPDITLEENKENVVETVKKLKKSSVPSNITCHCSGKA